MKMLIAYPRVGDHIVTNINEVFKKQSSVWFSKKNPAEIYNHGHAFCDAVIIHPIEKYLDSPKAIIECFFEAGLIANHAINVGGKYLVKLCDKTQFNMELLKKLQDFLNRAMTKY